MIRRFRLPLLLIAITLSLGLAAAPSTSASLGLTCAHVDPIGCSSFNQGNCIYCYDKTIGCCFSKTSGCIEHCI
jgi:hypothetical protein